MRLVRGLRAPHCNHSSNPASDTSGRLGRMKTNLTRNDAQARARLISNVHYTIEVDVTGAEQFTSMV